MRSVAFRLLAFAGGLAGSVLFADFVLRISNIWIGRHSDTMFEIIQHDSHLGWRMKPNVKKEVDLVDVENISIQTNRDGFWDDEFVLEKSPARCRIAFLGDSFTWGMGVKREERFSDLTSKLDTSWETLNFGVPAYGTDQSLLLWKRAVQPYHPDLVILTLSKNDYRENMYRIRYGRGKPYFELNEEERIKLQNVPVSSKTFWDHGIYNEVAPPYQTLFEWSIERRSRLLHWAAKHSDLFRFLYTFLQLKRVRGADEGEEEKSQGSEDEILRYQQIKLLTAIVAELHKEVGISGAQLLVVLGEETTAHYEDQKMELDRLKIPYLDATSGILGKRLSERHQRAYYRFSGHWTSAAHQAVAELIAEAIQKEGFCRQGTK